MDLDDLFPSKPGDPLVELAKQDLDPMSIEELTERIEALLGERHTFGWLDVIGGANATIVDVLSAFIALLELAKRGSLTLSQSEPFGPMVITRAPPREAA